MIQSILFPVTARKKGGNKNPPMYSIGLDQVLLFLLLLCSMAIRSPISAEGGKLLTGLNFTWQMDLREKLICFLCQMWQEWKLTSQFS